MNNHTVLCGYGSTGKAALADLVNRGVDVADVVVVDTSKAVVEDAVASGLVAVRGDASRRDVLAQAAIEQAASVIISPNRDDTAVLITLTVRDLNSSAHIVATGRDQENLHLLRQSGADEVIDATAAVGRMLGLGTFAPAAVRILNDLLDAGVGLEIAEVAPEVVDGRPAAPADATLIAVVRDEQRLQPNRLANGGIRADDRLVVLRESSSDGASSSTGKRSTR